MNNGAKMRWEASFGEQARNSEHTARSVMQAVAPSRQGAVY